MANIDVVGVTFNKNGRKYYFLPNNLKLREGLTVIVETERGLQFGYVVELTTLKFDFQGPDIYQSQEL